MAEAARLATALDAHQAGRLADAIAAYQAILAHQPNHPDALHLLGTARHQCGDHEAGAELIRRAIDAHHENGDFHNSLGVVLEAMGDLDRAAESYQTALAHDPNLAKAHYNLGSVRQRQGDLAAAATCFQAAIKLRPDFAEALDDLGIVLLHAGETARAITCFKSALATRPNYHKAYFNLLARAGEIADWQSQQALLPDLGERLRTHIEAGGDTTPLLPLAFALPYFCDDRQNHHTVLKALGRYYDSRSGAPLATDAKPTDRLRIGYVSADFGEHPISQVVRPVVEAHDRGNFEIFAYALKLRGGPDDPDVRELAGAVDHFVDLSTTSTAAAAERIASDGIQILIDLGGYMRFARPDLFARRPAPIQIYWQGHGGSLGAPYIDYVIGDDTVIPPGDEINYTEQVIRLPDCWSSAPCPAISETPQRRADHDLPDDAVVFCAFNNALKIEASVFAVWMSILTAVPSSVLWLTANRDPALRENMESAARRAGVDPARLVFAKRLADKADHMARHRLADLFLDTFHFNASVTALDALWAGLPVLTRTGNSFHSRLGTSYLNALGLTELACDSTDGYRTLAIELARDPNRLAALKQKLRAARRDRALFDSRRFTANLEAAYRAAWRRHSQS